MVTLVLVIDLYSLSITFRTKTIFVLEHSPSGGLRERGDPGRTPMKIYAVHLNPWPRMVRYGTHGNTEQNLFALFTAQSPRAFSSLLPIDNTANIVRARILQRNTTRHVSHHEAMTLLPSLPSISCVIS